MPERHPDILQNIAQIAFAQCDVLNQSISGNFNIVPKLLDQLVGKGFKMIKIQHAFTSIGVSLCDVVNDMEVIILQISLMRKLFFRRSWASHSCDQVFFFRRSGRVMNMTVAY